MNSINIGGSKKKIEGSFKEPHRSLSSELLQQKALRAKLGTKIKTESPELKSQSKTESQELFSDKLTKRLRANKALGNGSRQLLGLPLLKEKKDAMSPEDLSEERKTGTVESSQKPKLKKNNSEPTGPSYYYSSKLATSCM